MEHNLVIHPEYLHQSLKQGSPTGISPLRSLIMVVTGVGVIILLVRFVNANVAQVAYKPFALPHIRALGRIDFIS